MDEWLKQCWGDDYPIVMQAISKYQTNGFKQSDEEILQRCINISREIKKLKQAAQSAFFISNAVKR